MGATAANISSITLADRVNAYMRTERMTIKQLAEEINYSRTAVSRYLSGKYGSDPSEIEQALAEFTGIDLDAVVPATAFPVPMVKQDFFESADARSIIGVCEACQQGQSLGMIVGESGYGKTFALKHFAKMAKVAYIECDEIMGCRDLVKSIERALGIPTTYGSTWERVEGIREFFKTNTGYLLIIDEADKLISKYTQKKLEMLRSIFDQSTVGLVLAGEPQLKRMVECYQKRLENRISFEAQLNGLTLKELDQYLTPYSIEKDARKELQLRACTGHKSCFRLLDRTLSNAFQVTDQETITLDIIQQASNLMPV